MKRPFAPLQGNRRPTAPQTGAPRRKAAWAVGALVLGFALGARAQDGNAGVQSKTVASPIQMVEMMHSAFGAHHARAVHAKGIILEGSFAPAATAGSLTKAAHLQGKPVPVLVRFSDFTLTKAQVATADPNYLQTEIKQRVAAKPIVFKLYAQVAEKGDAIENPSIAWPDSRKRVLLGTPTTTKMAPNTVAEDKALFFSPNNVHEGINLADPVLVDRARSYPVSVGERQ